MTRIGAARIGTGLLWAALLGAMLWIGQVHVAAAVPGRWMPQAQVWGYSDAALAAFAQTLAETGLTGLYVFSNRWLDGAFAVVFGLWTALMIWPRRLLAVTFGALYACTDLLENAMILKVVEAPAAAVSSGKLGVAGYLTAQKFLLLALIAATILLQLWLTRNR